ncbi:hypothetical protein U1Q18_026226 [Sarracenia purpurea var. burkii]
MYSFKHFPFFNCLQAIESSPQKRRRGWRAGNREEKMQAIESSPQYNWKQTREEKMGSSGLATAGMATGLGVGT